MVRNKIKQISITMLRITLILTILAIARPSCVNQLQCFKSKLFNFDSPPENFYPGITIFSDKGQQSQFSSMSYGDFNNDYRYKCALIKDGHNCPGQQHEHSVRVFLEQRCQYEVELFRRLRSDLLVRSSEQQLRHYPLYRCSLYRRRRHQRALRLYHLLLEQHQWAVGHLPPSRRKRRVHSAGFMSDRSSAALLGGSQDKQPATVDSHERWKSNNSELLAFRHGRRMPIVPYRPYLATLLPGVLSLVRIRTSMLALLCLITIVSWTTRGIAKQTSSSLRAITRTPTLNSGQKLGKTSIW